MPTQEDTQQQNVPQPNVNTTTNDPQKYLKWMGIYSYIMAGLAVLGGLFALLIGFMGSSFLFVGPGTFGYGAASGMFMIIFIIVAVIAFIFAGLYYMVGKNVQKRSKTWWTIGMVLYGLGVLGGLTSIIGAVIPGIGLVLGFLGKDAVNGMGNETQQTQNQASQGQQNQNYNQQQNYGQQQNQDQNQQQDQN